jgi:PPM family protein phosphatase
VRKAFDPFLPGLLAFRVLEGIDASSTGREMRIEVAGHTHVGMKRNHNEDNYLLLPEEGLFCVADGMGGHSSGEIASKIAIEELAEFFKLTSRDLEATWP